MAKRSRDRRSAETVLRGLGHLSLWTLLVVAPFVVVVTAEDIFRLPKLLAAEWLGLLSLLFYALAAALAPAAARAAPAERPLPWWRRPAVLATAPVVAVASLGLVAPEHPEHTRDALPDLWIAAACLVGWSLAVDAERLGRLLRWLVLPAALMALVAVLQFHGLFRPFGFVGGLESGRLGVTSLAGNAGDLAAYLVLPALAAQWGLLRSLLGGPGGRRSRRWSRVALWAGALAVVVYGALAAQSLTPAAALLAGSAVFWLAALPVRRALAAAVLAVVLLGALVAAVAPLRERIGSAAGLLARGEVNAALTGRLDGWYAALWMVREQPWRGVGHGAYRAEFAPAKLELEEQGVELFPGHVDPFFANAHNDFLEAAAEWGLPGAAALLWGLWVLGRSLIAGGAHPGTAAERSSRAFAWAGAAAVTLLALGQFPFHLALVAYPCLVFLAWVFRRAAPEASR